MKHIIQQVLSICHLLLGSAEATETDEHAQALQQRVKGILGDRSEDRIAFLDLHDAMTVIKSHGKRLPEGMTEDLLTEINKEASKRMLALVAPGVELLKLSMGRMFDSVVQHMLQCASGEAKHQMYMYSGHDTTIMPLLATLGQDVTVWPPYVSNVIFEMWEGQESGKKQQYVRVLVNGKEIDLPNMQPGRPAESLEIFQPFGMLSCCVQLMAILSRRLHLQCCFASSLWQ